MLLFYLFFNCFNYCNVVINFFYDFETNFYYWNVKIYFKYFVEDEDVGRDFNVLFIDLLLIGVILFLNDKVSWLWLLTKD
jgi:hypothetical protein